LYGKKVPRGGRKRGRIQTAGEGRFSTGAQSEKEREGSDGGGVPSKKGHALKKKGENPE